MKTTNYLTADLPLVHLIVLKFAKLNGYCKTSFELALEINFWEMLAVVSLKVKYCMY